MADALLVENLTKHIGGIVLVDELDFVLETGTCLGVVGPNGAGKTSLFNLLDGTFGANRGRILLHGVDITHTARHKRALLGVSRAFQVPQPFPDLTVYENVLTAATFAARKSGRDAARATALVLERTGLSRAKGLLAGGLPLLDRKRLELARALAAEPKLLLLDEIAGGLTEHEVNVLVELVRSLKGRLSIIWIEHVAHALLATCDRIMVLHFGRKVIEGEPNSVMASAEVREIYMGIAVDAPA
ncbi:MAG TPA: ATP-binding cassette domain-containing protein [Rhizomicrobium sp.]|jgi:branched-chain amino acid transport system ATP-binding protein|nr:ATP-binding cassette domain-containing protein [Rhizomicrobium sp.]